MLKKLVMIYYDTVVVEDFGIDKDPLYNIAVTSFMADNISQMSEATDLNKTYFLQILSAVMDCSMQAMTSIEEVREKSE